jgi:hypothetical protein
MTRVFFDTEAARLCSKLLRLAADELPENFRPETSTGQLYSLLSNANTEAPRESPEKATSGQQRVEQPSESARERPWWSKLFGA